MDTSKVISYVILPDAPDIPGLTFRQFSGDEDWKVLLHLNTECKVADGLSSDLHTLETIKENYGPSTRSYPHNDILIAEVDGTPIAFARVKWEREIDGPYIYPQIIFVLPPMRGRGIERSLLHHSEARARELSAGQPGDDPRWLESIAYTTQPYIETLLRAEGYAPVRYFYDMVKTDMDNIGDVPMPEGLEVRPIKPEHYRAIWDASVEAFRDHWAETEVDEADYQHYLRSPDFQPELWQVAWDGDQVAGMVLNYINHEYNKKFNQKRGYTEDISVRRPWRRRGLASALIVRSQRMFRDMGMTEVALSVDTDNPSGALRLYENLGYREVRTYSIYRKQLEPGTTGEGGGSLGKS